MTRHIPALTWAGSRAALLLVLALVVSSGRSLDEALRGWDADIYVRLATQGYTQQNDVAFFPGLPTALRFISAFGVRPALAGAGLALVCSGLAAWALHRLGDREGGPLVGATAATLWLVAPTTVFTAVAYTEASFCAAAFWAWERARARQWGSAAALAGVACSLRVSGLFLIGALGVLMLLGNGDESAPLGERVRRLPWLLVPAGVLFLYALHLHGQTGHWDAWLQAQQAGWGRRFTPPMDALVNTWQATDPGRWPGRPLVGTVFLAEIVAMAIGLATTIICLVRRRWADASWIGVQLVAFGTSYWYMSVTRALLLWWPFFLLVALALAPADHGRRSPGHRTAHGRRTGGQARLVALGVLVASSSIIALLWARLYFTGQWAS